MYQRILVPVDGSDCANRGLLEAIGLACGVGRMLLGSDAEQILRLSPVPVLLVRHE